MMGTWMPETCREEKEIIILNRIVHIVGFICEILERYLFREAVSKKHNNKLNAKM